MRIGYGRVSTRDQDTALAPVQIYERCTADERRLLNHTLFHRLYLADNHITGHDEPPDGDRFKSHQPHQPQHLRGLQHRNRP